ncbi:MAG: sigma 54-interacting transcriptional regulator [Desulfobacterales bacterium]|nr:MAG: sigma 54-interacting transcriptional regulator [Desulfobacterales bacterium]
MLQIIKRSPPAEGRKLRDIFGAGSLQAKLRIGLIPPIVLVLILTGYITFGYYSSFIHEALDRTARLQVNVLAQDVEAFLAACAGDLRFIAKTARDPATLRKILASLLETSDINYRELAFISQKSTEHLFFFVHEKNIYQTAPEHFEQIVPDSLIFYEQLTHLSPGQVWVSSVLKIEYPVFSAEHPNQKMVSWVVYFGTHFAEIVPGQGGYLLLAVDAGDLRNILSAHRAQALSIWPYSQGAGKGGSYLFDPEGWILFESEDIGLPRVELGTDMSRAGYTGTLGSENLATAFKPDPEFEDYWKMIAEVRNSRSGVVWSEGFRAQRGIFGQRFIAYAPVRFRGDKLSKPAIYAGVAVSERTRLMEIAMFKQVDVIFIIILGTVVVLLILIGLLGRTITRPIRHLVAALDRVRQTGTMGPVEVPNGGREIRALQAGINAVLADIQQHNASKQIAEKEREASVLRDRTPVTEADLPQPAIGRDKDAMPEIMGFGTKIEKLQQEIIKAARADADVLIIGETGTGKQLAAEAIHRHSRRAGNPFVAINCGELDENLLLDTLFGHVKGAFTEAKTGRKGAFVEADGGILFLDEIQTASPRVQQALLRATAHRKIKPLGSDRESDIDVRLIAATNADLSRLVEQGSFRQDLYFRLKVITIATPPLREQQESISILAWHYFLKAKAIAQKEKLALTKGALEKMKRYRWPGNVRELINCITRAVVMAEGQQIGAEDILVEGDETLSGQSRPADSGSGQAKYAEPIEAGSASIAFSYELNARQAKIYPLIVRQGGITRSEYQAFWENPISSRTALYDLQNFVDKGLLRKLGQGPSTRYVPYFPVSGRSEGPQNGDEP